MRVLWNDTVIAESDETIIIEGNHYFPPDSVDKSLLVDSEQRTECFWKGTAHYYTLVKSDDKLVNAAWYYPEPKDGSVKRVKKDFSNYVAFYPNLVSITE